MADKITTRKLQTSLPEVMESVGRGSNTIVTKYDVPVNVIVSPETYAQLPGALREIERLDPALLKYFGAPQKNSPSAQDNEGQGGFAKAFQVWKGTKE